MFQRALKTILKGIRVHGLATFRVPPSNALIAIMNAGYVVREGESQRREIEFMVGLSMMAGRKFIQATEVFRKIESDILSKANTA